MRRNNTMLAYNPYIRIYLNPESESLLLLENLETKKKHIADISLLKLLKYCDTPRSKKEIVLFIKEEKIGDLPPAEYVQELLKNNIILDKDSFVLKKKSLELWARYNWMMAAHFILEAEDLEFEDRTSIDMQNSVLRRYFEKDDIDFDKSYYNAKKISLPKPGPLGSKSLKEVLLKRRTSRKYADPIKLQDVSTLLHFGAKEMKLIRDQQKKTYKKNPKVLLNSLFTPFELYVVANRIIGIQNGVYHYNVQSHSLEAIKKGNFNREMSLIAHGEMFLDNAAFIIVITGVFSRYMFRYRYSRAYKELLMTCSQLAHYLILFATIMDIKTFETPALLDSRLTQLFSLEEGEEGLYLLGFGK